MPTYRYTCSCGMELDINRKIDERDDVVLCGSDSHDFPVEMRRVFTPPGTVFRGVGWGRDEY